MDNSAYYCVPAALKFRDEVCGGEAAVMQYLKESMRRGGDRVAQILGTDVMDDDDGKRNGEKAGLRDCGFANVRLPITVSASASASAEAASASASASSGEESEEAGGTGRADLFPSELSRAVDYMQATFVDEFDTFIAVYAYKGRLWTRLSGQVYLEMADWKWCGRVLGVVCERVRRGEFREGGDEGGGEVGEGGRGGGCYGQN